MAQRQSHISSMTDSLLCHLQDTPGETGEKAGNKLGHRISSIFYPIKETTKVETFHSKNVSLKSSPDFERNFFDKE